MLNQSFSTENFRKIFDYRNRRGINLAKDFFPEVEEIIRKIKSNKAEFKKLRKKKEEFTLDIYNDKKEKIQEERDNLLEEKEELLTKKLKEVSHSINSNKLVFPLRKIQNSNKPLYVIEHKPCPYFAINQVQYNIKRIYEVKQSNRNEIVSQLKQLLNDTFPKVVVRADVKEFYESISNEKLISKLNHDSLLTLSSKKIIIKILQDYKQLSGSDKGIPRGVGISAYLSEIYMQSFDNSIRSHPDILYFSRYVDDVIAIFTPNLTVESQDYIDFIREQLAKVGLDLNEDKTTEINLIEPSSETMYYLGYDFNFGNNSNIKVIPSNKRIQRYKRRIELTFERYNRDKTSNEKKARKIFVKRLRFLTGNTKLRNNKRNALVGTYFSNSQANDISTLSGLDGFLRYKVSTLNNNILQNRISSLTFVSGFEERRFAIYSEKELKEISMVWKNEN